MVDTLRIKRRTSPAGAPSALANAELAYNEASNILYYGAGGTPAAAASILPIAGSGAYLSLGGGTLTGALTLSANAASALQPVTLQQMQGSGYLTDAPNNINTYGRRANTWDRALGIVSIGAGAWDPGSIDSGNTGVFGLYQVGNQTSAPNWPAGNPDQTALILHGWNSNAGWQSQLMMGGRERSGGAAIWYRSEDTGVWNPWRRLLSDAGLQTVTGAMTWNGASTFGAAATFSAGMNFGSVVDSGPDSVANHIALYSTNFGFGVTSARLNYVANAGSGHYFRVGTGTDILGIVAAGVSVTGTLTTSGNVTVTNAGPTGLNTLLALNQPSLAAGQYAVFRIGADGNTNFMSGYVAWLANATSNLSRLVVGVRGYNSDILAMDGTGAFTLTATAATIAAPTTFSSTSTHTGAATFNSTVNVTANGSTIGATTFTGLVQTSANTINIASAGWIAAGNIGTPGLPSGPGSAFMGWNLSSGTGEVNFVNAYTAAASKSFNWRQMTSASASTELAYLSTNGNLTLTGLIIATGGTLSGALGISPAAQVADSASRAVMLRTAAATTSNTDIAIDAYGTGVSPFLSFRDARGTGAAPTATQSGDLLGTVEGYGHQGSGLALGWQITGAATQTWTGSAQGTSIGFFTVANGATALAQIATITSAGLNVLVGAVNLAADPTTALQATTKQYVDAIGVPSYGSVAALRAASPVPSIVYLRGYAAAGDGGQGTFVLVGTDTTSADNAGTIIIDASGRRWHRDAPASVARPEWFGAKGDGATDDAAAINNAVAALPATGGTVMFEARQYKIGSTITLGNGTTTAASTRAGIVLQGAGGIQVPDIQPYSSATGTRLLWSGGTTTAMILVSGVAHGCGVRNMLLDGVSAAQYGIHLVSASFGDFGCVSIRNCAVAIYTSCNPAGASANNCEANRFHEISINVPATPSQAQGIALDGIAAGNSCFNDFENIAIQLPTTVTTYGIYLKGADTNSFRNLMIVGGGPSATAVLFDYTGVGNWPESNMFYTADVAANSGTIQWANTGSGNSATRPNMIFGLGQANGGAYPNIDNLSVDLPQREFLYTLTGRVGGIGYFTLYTPRVGGMFSIHYTMIITTAVAGGGSFTLNFACTSLGVAVNQSGGTVGQGGGTTQGSITVFSDGNAGIGLSVTANSITGSPQYALYVAITRLM